MLRQRVTVALARVPILSSVLKWTRNTLRSALGPGWLRRRVESQVRRGEPVRIILGAGAIAPEPGWIPTNAQFLDLLIDDTWRRTFGDHRIDAIFAEHVWEHLTPPDGKRAAAQCFKYLKPGGSLRLAVPDGNHPDHEYIEFVRPGGYGSGSEDHKLLYTYNSMRDMLESVGFKVELLEYYDEAGNFHESPWNPAGGAVYRRKGWTERKRDGSTMNYTSLIVDALRP